MTHKAGDEVTFQYAGTPFSAIIEQVNRTTYSVRLTKDVQPPRGKLWRKGTRVKVNKMMVDTNDQATAPATPKPPKEPLRFSPFNHLDSLILEAISIVYHHLSPENLTCDGELRGHALYVKEAGLKHKLRHLCEAYGEDLDEEEVYAWLESKREWEAAHPTRHTI